MLHHSKILFYLTSSMSFGAWNYFAGYTQIYKIIWEYMQVW
jgi:hypothetical protein